MGSNVAMVDMGSNVAMVGMGSYVAMGCIQLMRCMVKTARVLLGPWMIFTSMGAW